MIRAPKIVFILFVLLAGSFRVSVVNAVASDLVKAPSFKAMTLGGQKASLDFFEGRRFLVLAFFGVACKPCQKELALLNEACKSEAFRTKAQIYAVNADGYDAKRLTLEMNARGLTVDFPVIADDNQVITNQYVNGMVPLTVLIDRNETIVMSFLGARSGAVQKMENLITAEKDAAAK